MPLNGISYLELWWPFCLGEQNHLCNFGRGICYQEEQCFEIILNLDQLFGRCLLKIFLIWSSVGPFVQHSQTICENSVEGIIKINSVKLFRILASGSGGDVI